MEERMLVYMQQDKLSIMIVRFALPMDRWKTALNVQLPGDIRVLSVEQVRDDFHARYDAVGKTYRYIWSLNEVHSPFERNYSVHVERYKPNIELMKEASDSFAWNT